ncbi:hypothetical protein ACWEO9_23710, partial [Streptomyces albidoflavus]
MPHLLRLHRTGIERIAAEDPFVAHGVAEYAVTTTLTPGRVHPAAARLLAEDGSPAPAPAPAPRGRLRPAG